MTNDEKDALAAKERLEIKARHERYRAAVRRIYPYVTMRHAVTVNETADRDGAYIECVVFIPRNAIDVV